MRVDKINETVGPMRVIHKRRPWSMQNREGISENCEHETEQSSSVSTPKGFKNIGNENLGFSLENSQLDVNEAGNHNEQVSEPSNVLDDADDYSIEPPLTDSDDDQSYFVSSN